MKKMKLNFYLVLVDHITQDIYDILNINKTLSKGELGCTLSHLWCLNQIITNKQKNAIIFEDDIIFHRNFKKLFTKVYNPDIDFLMLGACNFSFYKMNKDSVVNNMYSIDELSTRVYGSHANFYSLNAALCMYEIRTSLISFFDKEYMIMFNHFKDTSFIFYPNLVITDINKSALNHEKDFLSLQETNYYNKCFINFSFIQFC
jgi:GR25 family glycosyltransferase involved in LPS biosynthesis